MGTSSLVLLLTVASEDLDVSCQKQRNEKLDTRSLPRCSNMYNPCPTPACLSHKRLHTKPTRQGFITSRLRAARNSGRLSQFYIVEELNKIPSVADNKCFSITAPLPMELLRSLNLAKGGFQCWRETPIHYSKKNKHFLL